jgi:hypothetical protein
MTEWSDSTDEAALAAAIRRNTDGQDLGDGSPTKNPAAVALGRLGGLKGGQARAKALSSQERSDIARRAALARWHRGAPAEDE